MMEDTETCFAVTAPVTANVSRGEDASQRSEFVQHDLSDGGVLDEPAHVHGPDRALVFLLRPGRCRGDARRSWQRSG